MAELVTNTVAKLGENIQIRRFHRFVLGEGIEKKETNFADEVAEQTGQKKAEPVEAKVEEKPAEEKNPPRRNPPRRKRQERKKEIVDS